MSDTDRAPAPSARVFQGADPRDRDGLIALFEACACPCYCRFWHFAGDKNDWQARCAFGLEESQGELRAAAAAGSDEARGVVVEQGGELVAWAKVTPALAVQKLYNQRFYRGLEVLRRERLESAEVFAVACNLVHPEHRGRSVAHALARGAVTAAREWGATALEAFPRVVEGRVSDEELWMGLHGAYLAAGLLPVDDGRPYPVLRIALR